VLLLEHTEHLKESINLGRCEWPRNLRVSCSLASHVERVWECLRAFRCLGSLLGLEDELVIRVDDHRKEELEALSDDLSEATLRYRLLVLLQHVLEAFVEHYLDLIHLEQLHILAKELVKRLVESFYWDLVRFRVEFGSPEVLYYKLLVGYWLSIQGRGQKEVRVEHSLRTMLLGASV
jgi:hypothetical protein